MCLKSGDDSEIADMHFRCFVMDDSKPRCIRIKTSGFS
jgi:hypothetical protein